MTKTMSGSPETVRIATERAKVHSRRSVELPKLNVTLSKSPRRF